MLCSFYGANNSNDWDVLSYFAEGKQFLLSQFFLSRPFFVVYFLALYHSHIQTQLVVQWDWDISCRKQKSDLLLWWKFPYSCILPELVLYFVHQLSILFCSVCPSSTKEISLSPNLSFSPFQHPFLPFPCAQVMIWCHFSVYQLFFVLHFVLLLFLSCITRLALI